MVSTARIRARFQPAGLPSRVCTWTPTRKCPRVCPINPTSTIRYRRKIHSVVRPCICKFWPPTSRNARPKHRYQSMMKPRRRRIGRAIAPGPVSGLPMISPGYFWLLGAPLIHDPRSSRSIMASIILYLFPKRTPPYHICNFVTLPKHNRHDRAKNTPYAR